MTFRAVSNNYIDGYWGKVCSECSLRTSTIETWSSMGIGISFTSDIVWICSRSPHTTGVPYWMTNGSETCFKLNKSRDWDTIGIHVRRKRSGVAWASDEKKSNKLSRKACEFSGIDPLCLASMKYSLIYLLLLCTGISIIINSFLDISKITSN